MSLIVRILGWLSIAASATYLSWVGWSFGRFFRLRHVAGDSHGATLVFILYAVPGAMGLALGAALVALGHILR